jgi:hypothetical protein
MISPKLGDAWLHKILITIGKHTHHAILDLGSSVSVLSKELYDLLELKTMKNVQWIFCLLMTQPHML